jgi:hypothetical protein
VRPARKAWESIGKLNYWIFDRAEVVTIFRYLEQKTQQGEKADH